MSVRDIAKRLSKSAQPGRDVEWISSKQLKPGWQISGRVIYLADVNVPDRFNGGERKATRLILETDPNAPYKGMTFSYAFFREALRDVKRDDFITVKYLGTVSQLEVLDPDLYAYLKELKWPDNTKIFEVIIKQPVIEHYGEESEE